MVKQLVVFSGKSWGFFFQYGDAMGTGLVSISTDTLCPTWNISSIGEWNKCNDSDSNYSKFNEIHEEIRQM